jgi:excisionase family DNA binding protein
MNPNDLLTSKQAAEELKVTESRIRQLILADKLPAQKFGRSHMIKRNDLKKVDIVGTGGRVGRPKKVAA